MTNDNQPAADVSELIFEHHRFDSDGPEGCDYCDGITAGSRNAVEALEPFAQHHLGKYYCAVYDQPAGPIQDKDCTCGLRETLKKLKEHAKEGT